MKKRLQLTIVCTGLLLIGAFFVFAAPRAFTYFIERFVQSASVLESVGKYRCHGYYYSNMFANGSWYGKYAYTKVDFEDNPYFKQVTQSDMDWVRIYAEHFSKCVDAIAGIDERECVDLVEHYDFDPACITAGDYVYFKEPVPDSVVSENSLFRFWFFYFDTESNTMYSFCNRINYEPISDTIGTHEQVFHYPSSPLKDYIHYGKSVYTVTRFEDNGYFKQVTQSDIESLHDFTVRFTEKVKSYEDSTDPERQQLFKNYDFSPDCITEEDYVYFKSRFSGCECIYFFDTESKTLYYFELASYR